MADARTTDAGSRPAVAAPPTSILGRAAEEEQLVHLLAEPATRLVSITGRAGVGKTRLATQVAYRLARGPVPVCAVPLAGLADPSLVIAEIARALEIHPLPGIEPIDAVASWIAEDRAIIVLDNFEHVLDAAVAVEELMRRCPAVQFLITSQAPLRMRAERVMGLTPLPVPDSTITDLDVLRFEPAVALFCERAEAVHGRFSLTDQNKDDVAELCRRLDGLPLAIELAAARAATLPPATIVAALDGMNLDVLRRAPRDAPLRHHDLRAAIDWTFRLLHPEEQALFARLAVVQGEFDLDCASALMHPLPFADVVDVMSSLVDVCLIEPVHGADSARFLMPSTIRTFASGELRESGDEELVHVAYIRWRATQARQRARAESAGDEVALATLIADRDELSRAFTAALDRSMVEAAVDLLAGAAVVWRQQGSYRPHLAQVDRLLAMIDTPDTTPAVVVDVLLWSVLLGMGPSAEKHPRYVVELERATTMARQLDDDELLLRALSAAVLTAPFSGDFVTAARCAAEGLAIVERIGDTPERAWFEVWAGMIAHVAGDDAKAIELGKRGLARARRTSDGRAVVSATLLLMPLTARYPDLQSLIPSVEETLVLTRRLGLAQLELSLLPIAATERLERGDTAAAARLSAEALRRARSEPAGPMVPYIIAAAAETAAEFANEGSVGEQAARMHGFIRDDWKRIASSVPPAMAQAYEVRLERVRAELGDDAFERAAEYGAGLAAATVVADAYACISSQVDAVAKIDQPSRRTGPLTPRQNEVLLLLVAGHSNKQIARALGVSPKTVTHHLSAVYETLGVRGRSEATAWAFRAGIVE
jgi:predicted ATPase/DNA-binding CsgD family transcriptional regulator